jgi:predicted KAP-like P-loop ATPase
MNDLQSRQMQSDYIEYMRQSAKWNERHNEEYRNLCSAIALPNSTMETYILRTTEPEEDNTILLSI